MLKINTILFDELVWENLLPLTYTKPVSELRIGITTLKEKWQKHIANPVSIKTRDYLQEKYPVVIQSDNFFVNTAIIPSKSIVNSIQNLAENTALMAGDVLIAFRSPVFNSAEILSKGNTEQFSESFIYIQNAWDIFEKNDVLIQYDFSELTIGRKSQAISNTNNCIDSDRIFIEKGAKVEFATLNATDGPIYIGKDAEIMEGALIRGPLALCEHATIKMGAKIYGATTIGPYCKAAGEIHNSVLSAYSNKGHDGYLGNSVLGEWCNLGADTNCSNLKNNYEKVRVWTYKENRFASTGLQFCGLIMGDHSKCSINTMFNTGTVVGVSANIFGAGFPRNFVPSFSWGGATGFSIYAFNKAMDTARIVMKRRNIELSEPDVKILETVFELSAKYRK